MKKSKVARTNKKTAPAKNLGGRPSDYKPEYAKQAKKLCLLGATDKDLADYFEKAESTINKWKLDYPEFSESLKEGKAELDAKVVRSLFERATGYSHPEDKIFNNNGEKMVVKTTKHYPPDATSMIFWLKNRQPDKWRDKQDVEHTGDVHIHLTADDTNLL